MSEHIIALYDRTAAQWDAARSRVLGPERGWLDRFVAATRRGGAVLDLGCGTGEPIARHLLAQGFQVTGVDASPQMISLARARLPGAAWTVADMRVLALGVRFDAVLAWHSVFHLSHADQRELFPVLAAHTAPGATLMFTSGPEAGDAIGVWQGEPLYHASLDPSEYRALLAAHDFEVLAHVARDPESGASTVWLARRLSAGERHARSR